MSSIATRITGALPRKALAWVAVGLLGIVVLIQLPFFLRPGLGNLWGYAVQHLFVLAWLLLVTTFTRTVPLRMLVAFWFIGVFPLITLDVLIGSPIAALFGGPSNPLMSGIVLPIVGEIVKPLPVIAFFAYRAWRNQWQPSATDGLLLGFAAGAGYAFHEDTLYDRVSGGGFGENPLSWLFPTMGDDRALGRETMLVLSHAGWNALIGLAIGAAFLLRSRPVLAATIPFAAWLMVVIDHTTANLLGFPPAPEPYITLAGFDAHDGRSAERCRCWPCWPGSSSRSCASSPSCVASPRETRCSRPGAGRSAAP